MKSFFQYLQPIFFLLFGCLLMLWSLNGIEFSNFKDALINIPLQWIFASMCLGYLAFIFRALRWKLLIQPLGFQPKVSNLVHAIAFGYLFNSFIPRSGEIIRCTALSKVTQIPTSQLLGHVLLERIIDFVILTIFIVSFIFNYKSLFSFFGDINLPQNLIAYLFFFLVLILFVYFVISRFVNSTYMQKIINFIIGIKQGFLSLKNVKNKFLFWLYTVLIWVCYLFMTTICFLCFFETSSFSKTPFLYHLFICSMVALCPFSIKSGAKVPHVLQ